jgi:dihydroxyacetone kinase-like protein
MTSEGLHSVIRQACQAVVDAADHLTDLDQAIGDGDHGLNMKRGSEAVLADIDAISTKPLPEALRAIGTHIVMTVGGASGPLYGTLFLSLGKELPAAPQKSDIVRAVQAAVLAVKARGKSDFGQKTLLDVLGPVSEHLASDNLTSYADLIAVADAAAEATVPVQATRGRASFLGERSIGHMDPGACSMALIIKTVITAVEGSQK